MPFLLQKPSEGRVITEVEFHPGVQRREGFRSISPGQAPQPWHGGLHPFRERGGARGPLCLSGLKKKKDPLEPRNSSIYRFSSRSFPHTSRPRPGHFHSRCSGSWTLSSAKNLDHLLPLVRRPITSFSTSSPPPSFCFPFFLLVLMCAAGVCCRLCC